MAHYYTNGTHWHLHRCFDGLEIGFSPRSAAGWMMYYIFSRARPGEVLDVRPIKPSV